MLKAEGTQNTGHGHVYTRPDGVKMRCGGPGICSECSKDLARLQGSTSGSAHPSTADAEEEWARLNSVFHQALARYPDSHHALYFFWNNAIAGPARTNAAPSHD